MALALVVTGLLLVRARDALTRWSAGGPTATTPRRVAARAGRALPVLTAAAVVVVGVSVAAQAALTLR